MSSLKQIEANRRNALKSTGPTTPEGKQCSRRNALRHGLTAETVITALEDSEDYKAFEAAVISDYDAESAVERELVLRLASVLWRLRRATGIETALFDSMTEGTRGHEHRLSRVPFVGIAGLSESNRLFLAAAQEPPARKQQSINSREDIAASFLRLTTARHSRSRSIRPREGARRCGAASYSRGAQPSHSRSTGARAGALPGDFR